MRTLVSERVYSFLRLTQHSFESRTACFSSKDRLQSAAKFSKDVNQMGPALGLGMGVEDGITAEGLPMVPF